MHSYTTCTKLNTQCMGLLIMDGISYPLVVQSGASDLLSGLTVGDMASALSSRSPPTASGIGIEQSISSFGMGPTSYSASNHTHTFQQQASPHQQPLQPTSLQSTPTPSLQPSMTSSGTVLQPSKYTPTSKQTLLGGVSGGTSVRSGYTPPSVRPQQAVGASSFGLGDLSLLAGGGAGQTSQTGFSGGESGILQPNKAQSGLTGPSMMESRNLASTVNSLFSGMQTGGYGASAGVTPQAQINRSMLTSSTGGNGSIGRGGGDNSGLFSGMQMNNTQHQQSLNQSLQGSSGGMLKPLVPTQQTNSHQQPIGNASTGWSSNISTQRLLNPTPYVGSGVQSQSQIATGWSSDIALGGSSLSLGSATTGSGWSQNLSGMGMQPIQTGMGYNQIQGGIGMGHSDMGGGGTWSSSIAGGGGANSGVAFHGGSSVPAAASLMMGGTSRPLLPIQQQQQPHQQPSTNQLAPGANPFADLSFLA